MLLEMVKNAQLNSTFTPDNSVYVHCFQHVSIRNEAYYTQL